MLLRRKTEMNSFADLNLDYLSVEIFEALHPSAMASFAVRMRT